MAAIVLASSKRVNVSPTTSILRPQIEDVDCSGSDFGFVPEDGQLVIAHNSKAVNDQVDMSSNAVADVSALGSGLAMVWSGGAQRVDQQALKGSRVPILRGPVRVKTKFFKLADASKIPSDTNGWVSGALVTAGVSAGVIQGSAVRYAPAVLAAADSGWAIGFVAKVVTDSKVAGEGEIEIQLYDKPVLISR